jgi:RNA polymerase sigma-70 factor (ECF subfamily)
MEQGAPHAARELRTSAAALPHGAGRQTRWSLRRDEDLLLEYARKETREPFEELVRRYERPLYAYLRRYLHDASLAEDAFQATFLEVHLRRHEFDPQRRFRPWVYRIATTRAIDLFRQRRRQCRVSLEGWPRNGADEEHGRPLEDLPDARALPPWAHLETSEDQQRLRLWIAALPARLRDVLVLILLRGLAYQEAADALGVPLGTVKSRLHEARLDLSPQGRQRLS